MTETTKSEVQIEAEKSVEHLSHWQKLALFNWCKEHVGFIWDGQEGFENLAALLRWTQGRTDVVALESAMHQRSLTMSMHRVARPEKRHIPGHEPAPGQKIGQFFETGPQERARLAEEKAAKESLAAQAAKVLSDSDRAHKKDAEQKRDNFKTHSQQAALAEVFTSAVNSGKSWREINAAMSEITRRYQLGR
jgi:hypothetical protein